MTHDPTAFSPIADALAERVQRALGREYVLERELGGGGMSRVFLARDEKLSRPVVIKVLPEDVAESLSRERFRREMLLSANLQHPHIVGVIDAGDAEGLPYFVMPFVDGESLRSRLVRDGRLSIPTAVSILRDVGRALGFAHARGVVHRDIKPDNILLAHNSALVADFGVAKAVQNARSENRAQSTGAGQTGALTSIGMSLGTPAYMAPEQVAADPATDHRADLYALGVTAYEMLTGQLPFAGRTPADLLTAQLVEKPAPPSTIRPGIPSELESIVMRCLEKDPSRRPENAEALVALLDQPAVVSGAVASTEVARARAGLGAASLRKMVIGAVALVVLAVATAIAVTRRTGAVTTPRAGASPAPASAPAIAVLPLVSVSQDSADGYIAVGMSDELTSALSRVRGLRVASRSAAAAARAEGLPVPALASRLGVTYLLEGTVQRENKRLRVTVRLVNGADGFTMWSDVFERTTDDLMDVQSEIANAVAEALRADLGVAVSDSGVSPASTGTRDLDAYNEYLRGHFLLERRGDVSLQQAVQALSAAIDRDSQFARAHAELAQAYALLPLYSEVPRETVWPKAVNEARRALALDSGIAAAHAALGVIANGELRFGEGRAQLQAAIRLDSSYAAAYQWLGENALVNGSVAEATLLLAQAGRRDPASPIIAALHAIALGLGGAADSAIATARAAVARDPSLVPVRVMLGTVLLYAGRNGEAARELEIARTAAPTLPLILGALGYAYARAGDTGRANAIADSLQRNLSRPGAASALAKVRLGLGQNTTALDALERALTARDPFFSSEPLLAPIFDPLRTDPRFARIVAAAGLDVTRLTRAR